MGKSDKPLELYEVGYYPELTARPNPSGYTVLQVPDFDTLIQAIENDRGQKFTSAEIEERRKEAPAIVLPPDEAAMMIASQAALLEPTAEETSVEKPHRGH